MPRPLRGERYRALHDVRLLGITVFGAPMSQSFDAALPAGTVVRVDHDPSERARAVYVLPEDEVTWEERLVPEGYRSQPHYGGWALCVTFEQLSRDFEPVRPAT